MEQETEIFIHFFYLFIYPRIYRVKPIGFGGTCPKLLKPNLQSFLCHF